MEDQNIISDFENQKLEGSYIKKYLVTNFSFNLHGTRRFI